MLLTGIPGATMTASAGEVPFGHADWQASPTDPVGFAGQGRNWYPGNASAGLVVRSIAVDPRGLYLDARWADPEDRGWVFHACGVREGRLSFAELQYHAPAAAPGPGPVVETSRAWGLRGPIAPVQALAAALLGPDAVPAAEEGPSAKESPGRTNRVPADGNNSHA